jgi:hypothetical protein
MTRERWVHPTTGDVRQVVKWATGDWRIVDALGRQVALQGNGGRDHFAMRRGARAFLTTCGFAPTSGDEPTTSELPLRHELRQANRDDEIERWKVKALNERLDADEVRREVRVLEAWALEARLAIVDVIRAARRDSRLSPEMKRALEKLDALRSTAWRPKKGND